ncbi:MAG: hypothetical protein PHD82_09835 [Candidatus Riflebacteria bacterium]|nr:hypothetical protein [Candidatus Riflebacteria bacterium]
MLSGASRVGSELAFAFGKPSLRSTTCFPSWRKLHKRFLRKSQAYEKTMAITILCCHGINAVLAQ